MCSSIKIALGCVWKKKTVNDLFLLDGSEGGGKHFSRLRERPGEGRDREEEKREFCVLFLL